MDLHYLNNFLINGDEELAKVMSLRLGGEIELCMVRDGMIVDSMEIKLVYTNSFFTNNEAIEIYTKKGFNQIGYRLTPTSDICIISSSYSCDSAHNATIRKNGIILKYENKTPKL